MDDQLDNGDNLNNHANDQSKIQKRSIFDSIDDENGDINDKSFTNTNNIDNNQIDQFDENSSSELKGQLDAAKANANAASPSRLSNGENEFNDESFNNMDAFSLANGDTGNIDFANDDEVESIAAGIPDEQQQQQQQVTLGTPTSQSISSSIYTSTSTSSSITKNEKSLDLLEGQKGHIDTIPTIDFDNGDGTGDLVQSEENGAVEVYDEDVHRGKVTTINKKLNGNNNNQQQLEQQLLQQQQDQQQTMIHGAGGGEFDVEDGGEDEKLIQDENAQSIFNGDAVDRAAMRQLKSFSPSSKSLDRSKLKNHHQNEEEKQQQQLPSLEDTGETIILGDSNVYKIHDENSKWQPISKSLSLGYFTGDSYDGQAGGEDDSKQRTNSYANSMERKQITQGERMIFMSDEKLGEQSDNLNDDLTIQDMTSINNYMAYGGHKNDLNVKKQLQQQQETFRQPKSHHGHSIHHSSLYSSLPVPFIFSAIRPGLQGHNKLPHGIINDRRKRTKDETGTLGEYHHSRHSSNVHRDGHLTDGHLNYDSNFDHNLKEISQMDDGTSNNGPSYDKIRSIGNDFQSNIMDTSSHHHSSPVDESNFNRLKRADSSTRSQQSTRSKGEETDESQTIDGEGKSSSSTSQVENESKVPTSGKKIKVKSKSSNNKNNSSIESPSEKSSSSSSTTTKTTTKPHHSKHGPNVTTVAPLINLVPAKKNLDCEQPAYLEFPPDIFGQKWRSRGFVIIHIAVVCYMFYCLAVVCDNYFLPALEECAQVS